MRLPRPLLRTSCVCLVFLLLSALSNSWLAYGGDPALERSACADDRLRAFDAGSGQELWAGLLPARARSTPMTCTLQGCQFVVIAAGGHGGLAGARGDSLVAFALPISEASAKP